MSVVFSLIDRRTRLGAILLDCLLTEDISFESSVTLYPVEDGTEISDHITQGAKRLRITGVISTADVSGGFGFASLIGTFADSGTKFVDVVEAIEQMHAARELVNIYTAQIYYPDMAFTQLNITRSADQMGGNWASIKAELIKIKKVKLKTADVPAPETTAEPATGRSGQTNKPAGKTNSNSAAGSGSGTYGPTKAASDSSLAVKGQDAVRSGAADKLLNSVKGLYQ